jgi:hypothetical protein
MASENPSEPAPIKTVRHPDINNPAWQNIPEHRRCRGHKKTGARCQRPAMLGGTVCRHHGGAAPHVKRAARARLENASLQLAKELLGMATDPTLDPAIKLRALTAALDRAGIGATTALDVSLELKPYEKLFERIERSAGAPPPPDAPAVVDGEVVPGAADFDDTYGYEP